MEYGGYFELEHFHGKEYHEGAIRLNSARYCLQYLIKNKNIKKIYLPKYICGSVIDVCNKEKIDIEYYKIDDKFHPVLNFNIKDNEYLYIVNYYGQLSNSNIKKIQEKYHNVILDNVQAFFNMPVANVDTLYSCRKFLGVTDGAYLYTNIKCDKDLQEDYSYERINYLVGRFELTANEFYNKFRDNEDYLDNCGIKKMAKTTLNILKGIDYKQVITQRRKNYKILDNEFRSINKLKLKKPYVPFMYPLLVDNAQDIREKLQKKKIYLPVLWPDIKESDEYEYYLSKNILNIVCDQRYNEDDIEYIINTIKKVGKF